MTLFDFMDKHWFLAFLIILFSAQIVGCFVELLIHIFVRRAVLIRHGYPPAHCDADGDGISEAVED